MKPITIDRVCGVCVCAYGAIALLNWYGVDFIIELRWFHYVTFTCMYVRGDIALVGWLYMGVFVFV
jgi:hypothetical protein